MNPYRQLVSEHVRFLSEGRSYPLGGFQRIPRPDIPPDAPKVLLFSPHPDDEVIVGGLALRLMREARWNVINVAVTLGSNEERQAGRRKELQDCCDCIGFGVEETGANGLEKVNPKGREQDPDNWSRSVRVIADILLKHRPRAIFFPHDTDWNSSHVGTHLLVVDALKSLPVNFSCHTIETEFWGQMQTPNLMVELSPDHVSDLITALTFHVGEVRRNPYHLTIPCTMVDNVRRGCELVGVQGGPAPDFNFATLYRLRHWKDGKFQSVYDGGRYLGCGEKADCLFAS